MPATVVIGGQWGDEGKGRVVDFFARNCSLIARYSAGSNAGHTIVNEQGRFGLHLVPSGIFSGKTCVIGNGVAINPQTLLDEIQMLEDRGIDTSRLLVSSRAHVVMPWHVVIDELDERMRGEHGQAIGTTGTGTGPAFIDKAARLGIRMVDLTRLASFEERLRFVLEYKNQVITKLYGGQPFKYEQIRDQYREYGERLAPYVTETATMVQHALMNREQILLEGAQGALLDLDSGTYPYVTSSLPSSVAAGACVGIGIGPTAIERVVGVYKVEGRVAGDSVDENLHAVADVIDASQAYMTRVGNGPFPTELDDEDGIRLREHGVEQGTGEYGTTTGRPRRCGWFDGVLSGYSVALNGVTSVALTRLDVLAQFERLKVCTGYELDGQLIQALPATVEEAALVQPVYEELPGWQSDITHVRHLADLPKEARAYVKRVELLLGAPVDMISVGPERDQAIVTRDIFGSPL